MDHSSLSAWHQRKGVPPDFLPAVSLISLFQRLENEETTSQFFQVIVSISELLLAPREIKTLLSPKT